MAGELSDSEIYHGATCRFCYQDFGRHSWKCVAQSDDAKLRHFDKLSEQHAVVHGLWQRAKQERAHWQGKFHTLRLENNGLRKQMHKLRERLKEMS